VQRPHSSCANGLKEKLNSLYDVGEVKERGRYRKIEKAKNGVYGG